MIFPRNCAAAAVLALSLICPAKAAEGFAPSANRNVFLLKPRFSGGTAFLLRRADGSVVLVTQVHVLDAVGSRAKLVWGVRYGSFFRERGREADAFELEFKQELLWKDDERDVALLKAPKGLMALCRCSGLDPGQTREEVVRLVGYPIQGRRSYPKTGRFWTRIGELMGSVEQTASSGKLWHEGSTWVSDADALSGDSGGPVLNEAGEAVGIIRTLRTWYGDGYRYRSPAIEVTPIEALPGLSSRK